jgi:hypothetical protein
MGTVATTYYPTNINVPRFDWASTAVVAQKNLFTYTEDLTNSVWTKTNSTISADAITDPSGLSFADKHIPNNGATLGIGVPSGSPVTRSTVGFLTAGVSVAFSFYAKAAGFNQIGFFYSDGTNTRTFVVSLVDGSIVSNPASGSLSVENAGSGWYRIIYVISPAVGGGNSLGFRIASQDSVATTGNGTNGTYIWGAQLETGTSATAYQAVGAFVPSNTPLLPASTCNGLLIEESRANRILWCRDASQTPNRNLLAYSEQFDQGTKWNTGGIRAFGSGSVANTTATTDPNGGNTADLIVEATSNAQHQVNQDVIAIAFGYATYSVYAKRPSGVTRDLYIQLNNNATGIGGASWATFDLGAGTATVQADLVSGFTNKTAAITDVGNGWYRCSFTITTATTTQNIKCYYGIYNAARTYTGDNTSGLYVWGAQSELATAVTTYEQTTLDGAIWSKQSVTVAKNQTGIDGVANAATSITATAANGTLIQPISLASGSRTASVYLKRITGTGNVQISLDGSTWSTVDLSSTEWRRIVLSGTVTNPVVGIRLATNGDAVAMDYAQVEDGAFATTPILTTTASATRAVDSATLQVQALQSATNFVDGTWYADVTIPTRGVQAAYLTSAVLGSNIIFTRLTNSIVATYYSDALGQINIGTQQQDRIKTASRRVYQNTAGAVNGTSGQAVSRTTPITQTTLAIGGNNQFILNGWFSNLRFYPRYLNNDELQNLTR